MNAEDIHVILLAAGDSRRFGSPKMEYILGDDKTILETSLLIYKKIFRNISVVLKKNSPLIGLVQSHNANVVINNNIDAGMSHSLVTGVKSQANENAWLIALADMPFIQAQTIEQLLGNARVDKIVTPSYKNQQGNPVIFGSKFKQALFNLKGDAGAKSIILKHVESVISVDVHDGGVLRDIDYYEDIRCIQEKI